MTRRLVVEADGGSRGNPGPAGYGALVRDAGSGELLAEVAEAIGTATNNVAEYRGLLAGLRAAIRVDPGCTVEVRMDSKLVVEQMSGRRQVENEATDELARQARQVLPPGRVTYTWVPRSRNGHADRLANEAMDAAAAGRAWSRAASGSASASAGITVSAGDGTGTRGAGREAPSSARAPHHPDLGPPTTLVLVRHGRTELTEAGRFSGGGDGAVDPPLSQAGTQDAGRAAQALARLGTPGALLPGVPQPQALICSPLLRTRQTAAAIGAACGLAVTVDPAWTEAGFGAWDGLTFAEIARGWPLQVSSWQGSTSVAPPGGESLDELTARIRAARAATVAAHPGRCVVVVSHVTPVRAVVQEALAAGPPALWRLAVAPCSLTVIRFWADGNAEVLTTNTLP